MDVTNLRMKIGPHEFEAEGPRELVAAHFEAWKQLIAARPATEATVEPAAPRQHTVPPAGTLAAQQAGGASTPRDIFAVDTARKRITLRVSPAGRSRPSRGWPPHNDGQVTVDEILTMVKTGQPRGAAITVRFCASGLADGLSLQGDRAHHRR